ncbi:helix-turn-helix transcriptional regulator [Azospirillum canadense]|uniref:helix-turn-helix transcriptional regulator n=1 Tax=Azospirillum canadense TaxID=403962 RepID=UPI002227EA31|nr:helix-turn-helix domain-containing protein [Azospirillum canadense]MCW2238166.1 putative DNA-binding transcriptional regulator AlpA [Azospirillum canadense]
MSIIPASSRHHLDQRVDTLLEQGQQSALDELLTTKELASWLGVSAQWLELGRSKGYGPPFRRISTRMIRYQRGDVRVWLAERKHIMVAKYVAKFTGETIGNEFAPTITF